MAFRIPHIMDSQAGTCADSWSAAVVLDITGIIMSFECWTENADFQISEDGGSSYMDAFEIDKDRPLVVPMKATHFKHKNTTPGSTATFQVLAFA